MPRWRLFDFPVDEFSAVASNELIAVSLDEVIDDSLIAECDGEDAVVTTTE
jgi:hypothetical protein